MLGNIEGRGQLNPYDDPSSAYSRGEIERLQSQKTLDSLQREMSRGQQAIEQQMRSLPARSPLSSGGSGARPPQYGRSEEESFLAEIQRLSRDPVASSGSSSVRSTSTDSYSEQMKLFREQMRLMDSMQQTAQTKVSGSKTTPVTNGRKPLDPAQDSSFRPLAVRSSPEPADAKRSGGFYTLRVERKPGLISAMIDQDLRVHAGGRVRIRLLQDIHVGGERIPRGAHLFAQVTGFQTTRINLSVTQIQHGDQSLPVQLDIYDTDGYLGLHVP
ncbi:MAG: conjugative transposon protein TraM, partial [Planctomycetaceae bacterium]